MISLFFTMWHILLLNNVVSPSLKFFVCTLLRRQENGRGRKKKPPMRVFLVCHATFSVTSGWSLVKNKLVVFGIDYVFVVVVIIGKTSVKLHTFIMHAAISWYFSQLVNMKRVKMSMHNKCMGLWGNLKFFFFFFHVHDL